MSTAQTDWIGNGGEALLAPAAELLMDASAPFQRDQRVLELNPGTAILTKPLAARVAEVDAHLVSVAPATYELQGASSLVLADPRTLPFEDDVFDHALANLILGRRSSDLGILTELNRVLRPGGQLVSSFLLDGTFAELFDLLIEACESEELHELGGGLRAHRAEQLDEEGAVGLMRQASFDVLRCGTCEMVMLFEDGASAVTNALVRGGFLAAMSPSGAPPLKVVPEALGRLREAVDTYFASDGLSISVRIGVARCLAASSRSGRDDILAPPAGVRPE